MYSCRRYVVTSSNNERLLVGARQADMACAESIVQQVRTTYVESLRVRVCACVRFVLVCVRERFVRACMYACAFRACACVYVCVCVRCVCMREINKNHQTEAEKMQRNPVVLADADVIKIKFYV